MQLAIVAVVVIAVGIGVWLLARRRAARRAREREIPLVFPLAPRTAPPPPRPVLRGRELDPDDQFRPPPPPPSSPAAVPDSPAWSRPPAHRGDHAANGHGPHVPSIADRTPVRGAEVVHEGASPVPVRAPVSIKYSIPLDGTLQFLPGRLEVLSGEADGREIRFVRTGGGPDGTIITFGRAEGPPYRHVQLREPTVSRNHARMRFDGSSWSLTNLSATNPVMVNGAELPAEGDPVVLEEGDRIEMGEVAFRFHKR
jgi:hypothetical protein